MVEALLALIALLLIARTFMQAPSALRAISKQTEIFESLSALQQEQLELLKEMYTTLAAIRLELRAKRMDALGAMLAGDGEAEITPGYAGRHDA